LHWTGINIDRREELKSSWMRKRRNSTLIIEDALELDFLKTFKENNLPQVIDYLSIDLETPKATLEVFKRIPLDKYSFNIITFEHDGYWRGREWTDHTRSHITSLGYQLLFNLRNQDDVYIHESMEKPSNDKINKILTSLPPKYSEIINVL